MTGSRSPRFLLHNLVGSDTRHLNFPATPPEGSNNWTVSGKIDSAVGKPLLANDPHRVIAEPSLRYMVHLVGPGMGRDRRGRDRVFPESRWGTTRTSPGALRFLVWISRTFTWKS